MRRIFALALLLLAVSACATGASGQFGGGAWRVLDINGVPVAGARPITLLFDDGGRISGNASCNNYSGTYQMSARQGIRLNPGAVTRMACEPAQLMEQERRYLELLPAIQGYNRYGNGDLSLIAEDGRAIRLRRT